MPSFLEDFVAFRRQSVNVAEVAPNALLILKGCFIRYTSSLSPAVVHEQLQVRRHCGGIWLVFIVSAVATPAEVVGRTV